ncbi:MAG: hypothetical protein K2O01_04575 [Bacteroidales bacterium]|nr:hypothetical protein [Bacteroidales bacterium]
MKYQTIIPSVLLAGLLFGVMPAAAQETDATEAVSSERTHRHGKRHFTPETFLPHAGDFAFSISANPFVNFVGNMFNSSTSNRINNKKIGGDAYLQPLVSVASKYMISDHFGVRVNLGWMYGYENESFYTRDDAAYFLNPLTHQKVVDRHIYNNVGASFNAAAEYRIGNRRIQGVVGGGLIYAFSLSRERFEYGNGITDLNPTPSVNAGMGDYLAPGTTGFVSQRYLSKYQGDPTHYFGLMGFVGFEWFLCPWFSLGAEVNVSAVYNWTQERYYEAEGFNTVTGQKETWTELISPRSHGFNFGTGNIGANLTITFYFNRNSKSEY